MIVETNNADVERIRTALRIASLKTLEPPLSEAEIDDLARRLVNTRNPAEFLRHPAVISRYKLNERQKQT